MFPPASECGKLIAAKDWSTSPLGPIAGWPTSLRATVMNMLHARQPMLLFWGKDWTQFYNDAFVPSFGEGKHPAAMGQSARECWAEVWPVVGAQLEAVVAQGEPAWYEDTLVPILRNGRMEEVFWTYSYSPAFDDVGAIAGVLVICTETTGRVLEARRVDALAQLATVVSSATSVEAVYAALLGLAASHAQDMPFVVVRDERRRRTHSTLDDVLTTQVAEAMQGESIASLRAPIQIAAWPEPVQRILVVHSPALQTTFGIGLSPRLPHDERYLGFLRQIAEGSSEGVRRLDDVRARSAMLDERNRLLMQAPVPTALIVGPDLVFELANPLYCKMVGRDPTGKPYLTAFPELASTALPGILERVYREGAPFLASEQHLQLEGATGPEDHYFRFNLEPLRDPAGNIYGMMAVASEITEQVRARQTLEEANRAKDEFLAMLGHELRNPLAPIVTAIELMRQRDPSPSRERDVIHRQSTHLLRLIDDLLDVARVTHGKIELKRESTDVRAAINVALEASSAAITERRHRVTVTLQDGLVVDADPARLVQILSNLITNAVRYTPEGGSIEVAGMRDGDVIRVSVRDSGRGLAPALRDRIFELFVQGPRAADRAEGGLGIGLSVVKTLVALHGGTITAESDGPGTGSTFTVSLPVSVDQVLVARPTPVAPRGSKRVLVVDDNEDAAVLLGEIIRASGYDVEVAHEPAEALRIVSELQPDIAVLDIGLPDMDGYELGARIQAIHSSCRLIALTGYGQSNDRERSAAVGFFTHLTKPVSASVLLGVLATT